MRFELENAKKWNLATMARRLGYRYIREDEKTGQKVLVRQLEVGGYPRFHLYLKFDRERDKIFFNLHLDQKRPVYEGSTAHGGEYEGKIVEDEAGAIKKLLSE